MSCADLGTACATDAQLKYYYDWAYADSALDVCRQYYKKADPSLPSASVTAYIPPHNPGVATCLVNGAIGTGVDLLDLTPEPMCFQTPNGPWKGFGTSGTYGAEFTSSQKTTVRSAKQLLDDRDPDDRRAVSDYSGDPYPNLVWAPVKYYGAQFDHIIPRVDIQGCKCGQNSYANMLVISQNLNGSMHNYGDHPARIDILQLFTLP